MPTSLSGKRLALEVCVTTADEARVAVENGADRLELCAAIELGGLTPSPGTFLEVRAAVNVPVWVLLRPVPGTFEYTPAEWAAVLRDAELYLGGGAAGVVCGPLDAPGRLHRDRCRDLARLAGGRVTLHRAIDFLPDLAAGLDLAIDFGFARILTSGRERTALEGAAAIRELVRRAAGRIEVLPGGGIRPTNVATVVRATGCDQVHGSFRSPLPVKPTNPAVAGAMGTATVTDPALVAAVRAELDRLAR
jgi:copper homeostasis protein CutC